MKYISKLAERFISEQYTVFMMGKEPNEICGYTWPENHLEGDDPIHQSCCYIETTTDSDLCVWHADNTETAEKTPDEFHEMSVPPNVRQQSNPSAQLLDGAVLSDLKFGPTNLLSQVSLREASMQDVDLRDSGLVDVDLRSANLSNADLSNADLRKADLRNACLKNADLSEANLSNANLSNSDLRDADLSDTILTDADLIDTDLSNAKLIHADVSGSNLSCATLSGANLTNANFRNANLTNATLRNSDFIRTKLLGTDLSGIDFRNVTLDSPVVNGRTKTGKQKQAEIQAGSADEWDDIARGYYALKTIFNNAGLIGKARKHHYFERRARGYEVKASTDLNPWVTPKWLGSFLSRTFIGYGVRVQKLVGWMVILFVGSTIIYQIYSVEDTFIENISYSVRAFTVAPPRAPVDLFPHIIMMVETFFGTLFIVLLGYVLSNREQF